MIHADESRSLRHRSSSLDAALARLPADDASPGAVRLAKIVNGGSLPTSVPAAFACQLLDITVNEVEGAVPTLTGVGDNFVCLVLGGTAPTAGTALLVELIGGFWVART